MPRYLSLVALLMTMYIAYVQVIVVGLNGNDSNRFLLQTSEWAVLDETLSADRNSHNDFDSNIVNQPWKREGCAIHFYGLPRAFGTLVLPSIIKNVIRINAKYRCDYFVHYYNQTKEAASRAGSGGHIDANDIWQLADAVSQESRHTKGTETQQFQQNPPIVRFTSDTNETFYQSHANFIHEVMTAVDETGQRPLYHPWMEKDYIFPTTELNILKMANSVDKSWRLMEDVGRQFGIKYTRVAMLRADVVFLTPIDIWDTGDGNRNINGSDVLINDSLKNDHVVIPSFARYPVNDRAICGNAQGVKIWATARWGGFAQHVEDFRGSGLVMHHERFVDTILLATIRQAGLRVVEHPSWCFCRARANQRLWLNDCTKGNTSPTLKRAFPNIEASLKSVQDAVGRSCHDVQNESVSGAVSALCQ